MRDRLLENLIKYPILFYIFYFVYTIRPPFKLMILSADKYESLFHYGLILWGLIIVGYNFLTRREIFLGKNIRFVIAWIIASVFTVISNISYITMSSVKSIILTILSMLFFLIGYPLLRDKYSDAKIFKYIFYPVLAVKLLINCISIYLYLTNISIFVIKNNILDFLGIRYVGIAGNRYTPLLYGLYKDPNFTAMIGVSLIYISIYIYISNKNNLSYKEKIFIYISVILEFIMVSFSNSRGALYSTLAVVAIILIMIILNKYREKNVFAKSTIRKIVVIVCATILVFVSYMGVQKVGFSLSQNSKFKRYIYAEQNNKFERIYPSDLEQERFSEHKSWILEYDDEENGENGGKITINKEDSGEEIGNGRLTIWKDTVKLFLKRPFFGIAPEMQKKISLEKYENLDVPSMKEGRSIHNSYLAVLLYYGVVGVLVLAIGVIRILIPLLINQAKDGYSPKSILFYGILFSLAVSFFLESIFVNIDFEQIYLMFLLGTVMEDTKLKGDN